MAREPRSDLRTAVAVQTLTLDDMTATLAELELSRAVVLMNGPAAEVKAAFDVLGRQPAYVQGTGAKPDREAAAGATPAAFASAEQHVWLSEVRASLTEQPLFPRRLLMIVPGVSRVGTEVEALPVSLSGYSLGAGLGYRYGWFSALGAYVSLGMLDGTNIYAPPGAQSVRLFSTDVLGFGHLDGRGRLWGDLLLGLHLDRLNATQRFTATTTQWRARALGGIQAGIDVARFGTHRIGIGVRWDTTTRSATEYFSLSLGLVYRR
jgi:hypothetical protein